MWITSAKLAKSLLCAGVFALVPMAHGADAPTRERWQPVEQALATNPEQAKELLDGIIRDFPQWVDGLLARIELLENAGELKPALADARTAVAAEPEDPRAQAALIHLLVELGSTQEAATHYATVKTLRDPKGWVHYHGAEANFAIKEYQTALAALTVAKQDSSSAAPGEFDILLGYIHEALDNPTKAIGAYRTGLKAHPDNADAWFNLGTLQRRMAQDKNDPGAMSQAATSFASAATYGDGDPLALFAGAQCLLDAGEFDNAQDTFSRAIAGFEAKGVTSGTPLASSHAGLGIAHLELARLGSASGSFVKAADHLDQAERIGLQTPAVYENLIAACNGALAKDPDGLDAAVMRERIDRVMSGKGRDMVSLVNIGMSEFAKAQGALKDSPNKAKAYGISAAGNLTAALNEADVEDPTSVKRYLGHSHGLVADALDQLLRTDPENPELTAQRDAALDAARDAYRDAGNAGDALAQDHFLARESRRDPKAAYAAGWQMLRWRNYLSMPGTTTMIRNYGLAEAWRSPIHMGVWGICFLALLILGIKGFFFPPLVLERQTTRRRNESVRKDAPAPERRPASNPPKRKPSAPPQRVNQGQKPAEPKQERRIGSASHRRAVDDVARRLARNQQIQREESPANTRTPARKPQQRRRR